VSGLAGHSLGAGLAILVSAALSTHSAIPVIGFRSVLLSNHAFVVGFLQLSIPLNFLRISGGFCNDQWYWLTCG
jgi:hypothetical protein